MEAGRQELFYLSAEGKMMAVPVKLGTSFEACSPRCISDALEQPISAQDVFSYDISADGQRFLNQYKVDEQTAAPLAIILQLGFGDGEVELAA